VESLCIFVAFFALTGGNPVAPVLLSWSHQVAETGGTGLCSKFSFACVQGELFVIFELLIGGLRSFLEQSFVLHVSSRCPCLRDPRLVFFK
jgi:hypothetical protein